MQLRNKVGTYTAIALTAMAVVSCGQKHKTKELVSNYLNENLVTPTVSGLTVSDIDSSFYITPTVIERMKSDVQTQKAFKKSAAFGTPGSSKKVLFTKVQYINGKDTLKQTFYFDEKLTQVIAFKSD